MEKQTLLSVREASFYMGWSPHHTRKMMADGDVPYIKKGRRYFIVKEDLDAFMERNKKAYREYLWWRVKQSWPIGNSYQEYLYYILWLEETGVITPRKTVS